MSCPDANKHTWQEEIAEGNLSSRLTSPWAGSAHEEHRARVTDLCGFDPPTSGLRRTAALLGQRTEAEHRESKTFCASLREEFLGLLLITFLQRMSGKMSEHLRPRLLELV